MHAFSALTTRPAEKSSPLPCALFLDKVSPLKLCGSGARPRYVAKEFRRSGWSWKRCRETIEEKSTETPYGPCILGSSYDGEGPPRLARDQALCIAQSETFRCVRTMDELVKRSRDYGPTQCAYPEVDGAT